MWLVVLFSLTLGLVFLQEAAAGGGLQVRFEPYRLSLVGCCFEYDPKDTVKIWIAS
jgi:hypothetical protein